MDTVKINRWLKSAGLKVETEGLRLAAQDATNKKLSPEHHKRMN